MMSCCNFCSKSCDDIRNFHESNILICDNSPVKCCDLIHIFNGDIVKLILGDKFRRICGNCLAKIQAIYEFVQQIKLADKQLNAVQVTQDLRSQMGAYVEVEVLSPLGSNLKKILPKINLDTEIVKETVLKNRNSRMYKCSECSKSFTRFKALKEHEQRHAFNNDCADVTVCYVCQYCHLTYKSQASLDKHVGRQHNNRKLQCYSCRRFYISKGYLLQHCKRVHQRSTFNYYCGECPETVVFQTREIAKNHFLQNHVTQIINTESVLADDNMDLEMHEEFLDEFLMSHTNENSFQFSECWEHLDLNLPDMLQPNPLQTLLKNEGTCEAFPCPQCAEQYKQPQSLLKHLNEKHNFQLVFCKNCCTTFATLNEFTLHLNSGKCAMVTTKALLSCPYCSKFFQTLTQLKQHLRIVHTQKKRHICQLCDKQYATVDHLKKHVLSQHQNERRHICHVCAKRFTQMGHLRQHLAIHTTGKTVQCADCSQKFWRKIDLKKHRQKKHNAGEDT
ncbi:telomere zinc finger-associated protein-like [Glossina fuscipes]|uniref:Telomere zinc finger-associated protein-like n=1 Tax=Glossina fuscipes TaxID=7396 RepID=A0A9C5YWA7_9MUSC|nr:telomere zinc finger-associated protein-like [Glossina fuscipes]KAI9581384.1 hypothetical protein GQX74_012709 [Glossina fuscipes]